MMDGVAAGRTVKITNRLVDRIEVDHKQALA